MSDEIARSAVVSAIKLMRSKGHSIRDIRDTLSVSKGFILNVLHDIQGKCETCDAAFYLSRSAARFCSPACWIDHLRGL